MERICSKCGYHTRAFGISILTGGILCPYCKAAEKRQPGFEEARLAVMAELGMAGDAALPETAGLPEGLDVDAIRGVSAPEAHPDSREDPEEGNAPMVDAKGNAKKKAKPKQKKRRKKRH